MHSFTTIATALTVAGVGRVAGRAVQAPTAVVTPAPSVLEYELIKRQDPDAISLAQVLLTAVPESLRQIAATNVPAVSSILWEQFLDDKKPEWFLELPWDIQTYLIKQFGPSTAIPTATGPVGSSVAWTWPTVPVETQPTQTESSQPGQTSQTLPAESSPSQSQDASSSIPESTSVESSTSTSSQSTSSATPTTMSTISTKVGATASTDSASSTGEPSSSTTATLAGSPSGLGAPGLTKGQKVGIGLGVSLGLLAVAALAFGCCILLRRRQRKKIDGSIPPSSPGFIPRFAFQEKPIQEPNERLLNPAASNSFADLHNMAWEDEYTSSSGESVPTLNNTQLYNNSNQPIMAPALFHTHSSNRARGKRTSYTSLHSVAEVSEPDDDREVVAESPVLPRNNYTPPKRYSPPRPLLPAPTPASSQIKRKPVGSSRTPSPAAAHLASQTLLHQTMPGPSSVRPRPRLSTTVEEPSAPSSRQVSPYVSPLEENFPSSASSNLLPTAITTNTTTNPSSSPHRNSSYEEDYGPEYHHNQPLPITHPPQHPQRPQNHRRTSSTSDIIPESSAEDAYIDILYGGNTDLSRYPEPSSSSPSGSRNKSLSSRTEWPLRNFSVGGRNGGAGHRRNKSPLWDRIYEN